ncbi:MAG: alpha/beta hydrolase [Alphaproteobacteria bacterium]|nr:alpha/beta hydrolase [Alphaproteobacteria bacterium]
MFGPYSIDVAKNAPVASENCPLVVISHGNGGSPWVHRDLAAHLAQNGFVVGLPEHIGNSRTDNSLEGTIANLENRPHQLSLCIDGLISDVELKPRIDLKRIGAIGHSIGAYTALAIAGGRPKAGPHETPDGVTQNVAVHHDKRIQAVALLAPATPWFRAPGALAEVTAPIFMRTGAMDTITDGFHSDIVLNGVSDKSAIDHKTVDNAGHFSFQSPFPEQMTQPGFPPSQDPIGFDRPAYQKILHQEVLEFFQKMVPHR